MADGSGVASTPHSPHRRAGRLLVLVVLAAVFGSACSATPSWTPLESADPATSQTAPGELAFVTEADGKLDADTALDPSADSTLTPQPELEPEPPAPSDEFCGTSANIWIHTAALNLLGGHANEEMTTIALANAAEWMGRSMLFDEPAGPDHTDMLEAFTELQLVVKADFDFDWVAFQSSSAYANNEAAKTYDAARSELVSFLNDDCDGQRVADLRTDAEARAVELIVDYGADPSTVVESDSLPGHSIFTHTSGRLIASFPTAWSYEERSGPAIVDFVASPDVARFLEGEAIDGVHLQLIEAATLGDFRLVMAATMTGSSCELSNELTDRGVVRENITQTFTCSDHGASIVGQYNETAGLGLLIEASFDRPEPSRADLIRLASIANSALWS